MYEERVGRVAAFAVYLPHNDDVIRYQYRSKYPSLFGAVKIHSPSFISSHSHFNLHAQTICMRYPYPYRFEQQTVVYDEMKYICRASDASGCVSNVSVSVSLKTIDLLR